jgi:toxin ParE1/3/4
MGKKYIMKYLPIATNDLIEILEYIKVDSPKAALDFVNRIDETIVKLKDFPELGVIPKDKRLKKLGYRTLIIGNYIVFYVVLDDIVEIRRVLHGSRNYKFLL